ncbi:uncharacterized protein C14orf80 homolog [Lingula anatina]|uniref:Uncharacterized protein C14orf80 homolog n=1 Tax=Lingula anatina TaxID=7574 RepID=A0A2R2MLD8_LINAN|nr:uncharacterized protein C14orf80 homolog [Lingula anatina]|eukprot:XP_023931041.1 uncharacterized protein C14orf80 homolog [Lingula anatina]
MAQIRDTIELLTKVLKDNGTHNLKAETFRLAKFDNDDAVSSFWRLLFELIYFLRYGIIDDVCVKAFSDLTKEELVVFVKREMQQQGFTSVDFNLLPADMSTGSRDLLLAFGWLMCKEGIIDKFMESCASPLAEDTIGLYMEELGDGVPDVLDDSHLSPRSRTDPVRKVKQLLWLNGKLRLSLRNLYALQRERAKLMHKLHQSTNGISLDPEKNHLSMLEVYMLRHPELLKKNLQLLEKDNIRLQNLLEWKSKEDIFWKWMESVLDAKIQAYEMAAQSELYRQEQGHALSQMTLDKKEMLQKSHDRLRDNIIQYEAKLDELERLWNSKKSNLSQEEVDNLLAAIDLDISLRKVSLALGDQPAAAGSSTSPLRLPPKEYQYTYVKKPSNQDQTSQTPSMNDPNQRKSLRDENKMLSDLKMKLKEEINSKQDMYRDQMNSLANHFEDVVCIPKRVNAVGNRN